MGKLAKVTAVTLFAASLAAPAGATEQSGGERAAPTVRQQLATTDRPESPATDADVSVYDGPEDPSDVEALKNGEAATDEPDEEARDDAAELPGGATALKAQPPSYTLPINAYFEDRGLNTSLSSLPEMDRQAVADFYMANGNAPIWVDKNGFNGHALRLIEVLADADNWGLKSARYDAPALSRLLPLDTAASAPDSARIAAELQATIAAITYARDARGGRIEKPAEQLSSYLDRKPRIIETGKLLVRLSTEEDRGAYLLSLHPKHEQFEKLRQLLIQTRNRPPEELVKIPRGKLLKPGRSHPHVALVRERLKVAEPGMKPDGTAADATYYDDTLAEAVKRYKERNDLEPDTASINNTLRNHLNADRSVGEEQILANMEQWRWMPETLGDFHIAVNVPEFLVRVNDNGVVIHEERVITGTNNTQTPIFSHKMRSVTFQPVWNVPQSIIINEILPGLRAGRNSIGGRGLVAKRNGRYIDPWSVDWYRSDIRNYHIYQPPGPGNALGIVKFMFPNKHAVYLHDTPKKSLFKSSVRNFSHGCVRVRNPGRLAEIIMAHDRGWDQSMVREVLNGGPENNDVVLNAPVPVHITYFTLWVEDGGKVRAFNDVYGHERRIRHALNGNWNKIARHADHLAPVKPAPARRPQRTYSGWDFFDDQYGYGNTARDRRRRRQNAYAYGYEYERRQDERRRYRQRRNPPPSFFEQLFGN